MAIFEGTTLTEARTIIARYPAGRERSSVMPLLYLAQSIEGRVTRDGLREVAALLGLTTAEVEAVASFYTMLRLRPTGRHVVSVCTNLSCALRGAKDVYEAAHQAAGIPHGKELSEDELITLHEEECLGACEKAPVVSIDFVYHDDVTPERMGAIIAMLRAGEIPVPSRGEPMKDFRAASRLLAGLPPHQVVDA
jgi:NADH-quinone oxidoreductase subunit E